MTTSSRRSRASPAAWASRVEDFNDEISYQIDQFFETISDGIDWVAPFMPWVFLIGVVLAVAAFCFL